VRSRSPWPDCGGGWDSQGQCVAAMSGLGPGLAHV